jgi:hypothetical protein
MRMCENKPIKCRKMNDFSFLVSAALCLLPRMIRSGEVARRDFSRWLRAKIGDGPMRDLSSGFAPRASGTRFRKRKTNPLIVGNSDLFLNSEAAHETEGRLSSK